MNFETTNFYLSDIEWIYLESKEIRVTAPAPAKGGIRSLNVGCKKCGHRWRAGQVGRGRLQVIQGESVIACPMCKVREELDEDSFKQCP